MLLIAVQVILISNIFSHYKLGFHIHAHLGFFNVSSTKFLSLRLAPTGGDAVDR